MAKYSYVFKKIEHNCKQETCLQTYSQSVMDESSKIQAQTLSCIKK